MKGGCKKYWGKRAGGFFDPKTTKGLNTPNGNIIKIKRRGPATSSSAKKPRSHAYLLVQQALARGFLNGKSILKRATQ